MYLRATVRFRPENRLETSRIRFQAWRFNIQQDYSNKEGSRQHYAHVRLNKTQKEFDAFRNSRRQRDLDSPEEDDDASFDSPPIDWGQSKLKWEGDDEAAHGLPPEIAFYTNSRFDLIALHQ